MQTRKMAENNNYDIYLDGCKINRVHEAKFLGIIIDENFPGRNKLKMFVHCAQETLKF